MLPKHIQLVLLGVCLTMHAVHTYKYYQDVEATTTPRIFSSSAYNDRGYHYYLDEYFYIYTNLSGKVIQLEVNDVNHYFKIDCSENYIVVYDGRSTDARQITQFCGTDSPKVKSSGPEMYVNVVSIGVALDGISFRCMAADPGPGVGVIVGCVIAAVVVIAAIAGLVWYCKKGAGSKGRTSVQPQAQERRPVTMVPTSTNRNPGNAAFVTSEFSNAYSNHFMAGNNAGPAGTSSQFTYGGYSSLQDYGGGFNPPTTTASPHGVPTGAPPAYSSAVFGGEGEKGGSTSANEGWSFGQSSSAPYPPSVPSAPYPPATSGGF